MTNDVILAGVNINCVTHEGAIGQVVERIAQRWYKRPISVFTPNTEQLVQAVENPAFLRVLNASDIRIPDSIGLARADWWHAFTTGRPWRLRERVTGADLAESLLFEAVKRGWKVVVVGGMGNSSQNAVENLKKRFDGLSIWWVPIGAVTINDKNMDLTMENEAETIAQINEIKPDLVLVGLGAPKQEVWVLKYGGKLQTQALMVVGGTIDFWSGVQKRAPRVVQRLGMEWLWRLLQQPWRIGRQLRLVKFVGLVVTGRI